MSKRQPDKYLVVQNVQGSVEPRDDGTECIDLMIRIVLMPLKSQRRKVKP